MFYHSRPLKYVTYGTVQGNPEPDEFLAPAYRWLSHWCGFFPQVWLARGSRSITGWRSSLFSSKKWFRESKKDNRVLFGFDMVPGGFGVDYECWHFPLSMAETFEMRTGSSLGLPLAARKFERELWESLVEIDRDLKLHGEASSDKDLATGGAASMSEWLEKSLFVVNDQVVIPSLNLKTAKLVVCRDERTKAVLRRLGFIEDRIEIRRNGPGH